MNAIVKTKPAEMQKNQYGPEQIALIKRTIAPTITDDELQLFVGVCKRTGLDPFARQIYAIPYNGRMSIQTSIDGFRLLADRTGKYSGQLGPFWCGEDGQWVDVWLKKEHPSAAKVGVLRKDFDQPMWGIARWDDFSKNTNLWKTMGPHMLAIRAESQALRKANPQELSGLYTREEMEAEDMEDRREYQHHEKKKKTPPPIDVWENYFIPSQWLPEQLKNDRITYKTGATDKSIGFRNSKGYWNTLRQFMAYTWLEGKPAQVYQQLRERYPSEKQRKELSDADMEAIENEHPPQETEVVEYEK